MALTDLLQSCIKIGGPLLVRAPGPSLQSSREILVDDEAPASFVLLALESLYRNCLAWEPESVWLELNDDGIDLSEENRNKFLAASTLLRTPAFFWDANIFEDTCLAFNNAPVIVDVIQESSPGQLAWGVFEAHLISQIREPELAGKEEAGFQFDFEPSRYTATVLHRLGFVLAPELLEFSQKDLDALNKESVNLKSQVEDRWTNLQSSNLLDLQLQETPLDVQIANLAAVDLYVQERAENFLTWANRLTTTP